jgi:hypothetical protein
VTGESLEQVSADPAPKSSTVVLPTIRARELAVLCEVRHGEY